MAPRWSTRASGTTVELAGTPLAHSRRRPPYRDDRPLRRRPLSALRFLVSAEAQATRRWPPSPRGCRCGHNPHGAAWPLPSGDKPSSVRRVRASINDFDVLATRPPSCSVAGRCPALWIPRSAVALAAMDSEHLRLNLTGQPSVTVPVGVAQTFPVGLHFARRAAGSDCTRRVPRRSSTERRVDQAITHDDLADRPAVHDGPPGFVERHANWTAEHRCWPTVSGAIR